jgi:hypothetical protein
MTDRLTVDLKPCIRCRGEHEALGIHRRSRPIQIGTLLYSFWALCPTTTDVIHLRISETEVSQS